MNMRFQRVCENTMKSVCEKIRLKSVQERYDEEECVRKDTAKCVRKKYGEA